MLDGPTTAMPNQWLGSLGLWWLSREAAQCCLREKTYKRDLSNSVSTTYIHAQLHTTGGMGILKKLSLCYNIVYCYNGAERYEQFLQVGRLYRALVLPGLVLCLPSASVPSVLVVLCIINFFCLHPFTF